MLAFANFNAAQTMGLQHEFLRRLGQTLLTPAGWGLHEFVPKSSYTSDMIPPFALARIRLLRILMEVSAALGVLAAVTQTAACMVLWLRTKRQLSLVLLLLSGWFIFAANSFVRVEKNDYEGAYTEPLLGLLLLASFWAGMHMRQASQEKPGRRMLRWAPFTLTSLFVMSIVSQICFLSVYAPKARDSWRQRGQPASQKYSVSVHDYASTAHSVTVAARMCRIDPATQHTHLVLDESSYFVFRRSKEPVFITYFDPHGWGVNRPDPTSLFQAQRVEGIVVQCNRLPDVYKSRALEQDGICCLPGFTP